MRALVLTAFFALTLMAEAAAQSAPESQAVPLQEGTAVVQEDGSVVTGEQVADGRPDPDREVVCRVIQESGSRLARRRQRVCGTRTMWEQMEDQNARDVRSLGSVQGRQD